MVRLAFGLWVLVASSGAAAAATGEELFASVVQPLLKQNCQGCHGTGQTLSQLDLTSRAGLLQGGSRGTAILPGKAAESLLYKVLNGVEPAMPPGGLQKRLPAESIRAVKDWIDAGAPWPVGEASKQWRYEEKDLWAFRPVRAVKPEGSGNPIDWFIGQKLKEKGLSPAPRASRRDLIRRVSYSLTGLPPSMEEIRGFENDTAAGAWDRLIRKFLDSPRYGEKWGRHWLDVTRYGDTDGFSNDYERPNAWRYRDYVVRSFNADKPYDQFIVEQIAGDELDRSKPDNLIATGFLRMGPWEHTAMSVAAVTRQQWLDDVTHSVATAFQGLTFGCARCHDHKFDPISTAEYYSLQSVFASTFHEETPAAFQPNENTSNFASGKRRLEQMLEWVKQQRSNWRDTAEDRTAAKLGLPGRDRLSEEQRKEARGKLLNLEPHEVEIERTYSKRQEVYLRQLKRYEPLAYSVKDGEAEVTRVLIGGNLQATGATVVPAVLKVPARYRPELAVDLPQAQSGRRLALARWIARPDNPLTARVMVNRIWAYHFGKGLAANPNNFGKMGSKPALPELLDYLADYFVKSGWSVKAVHRLILSSEAFQRAAEHPDRERLSTVDPENQLLTHFMPRRLEAEELRDTILGVSGELNLAGGGPGSFAEINEDVALQPVFIMGQLAPIWRPSSTRADRHVRSVYLYQKRGVPDPLLEMFNQPGSSESCERRDATTVPMQVFALFNAEFPRDMALALADRVAREESTLEARVQAVYQRVFGRPPRQQEKEAVIAHVQSREKEFLLRPLQVPKQRERVQREVVGESNGLRITIAEEEDPSPVEPNLKAHMANPGVRALASAVLSLINSNEFLFVY